MPKLEGALNLKVLLPLLAGSTLLQIVVPLSRVTTSYSAIEIDLSLAEIGTLSSAFALLPVFFAVRIGRHNDEFGERHSLIAGSALVGSAVVGLWLWSAGFVSMLAFTCLLGIGQVMLLSSQQMMTTRCSPPEQQDRVLGMFLVATALGHVIGPLIISITTPAGSLYPDARLFWLIFIGAVFLILCSWVGALSLEKTKRSEKSGRIGLGQIVRTPGLPMVIIASSLCLATNDLMTVFFPVLGASRGIDAATVGLLLSLRAVFSMLSRLVFARLTTRFGKLAIMVIALGTTAIATGSIVVDLPIWGLAAALAISGFMMGLAIACSLSLTLSMSPIGGKATTMSLRLTAARLCQFVLPVGAGALATILGPGSIFAMIGTSIFICATALKATAPERQ